MLTLGAAARGFRNIAEGVKEMWTELLAAETAVDKEAGIAHQEGRAPPSPDIFPTDSIDSDCDRDSAARYSPCPDLPLQRV